MKFSNILIAPALLAGSALPALAHTETAQATHHHLATHLAEAGFLGLVMLILFTGLRILYKKR